MKRLALVGRRFNRVVVTKQVLHPQAYCIVICDCGNEAVISQTNLVSGHTKSCGCLFSDSIKTHNKSKSSEYRIWSAMKQRCGNPRNSGYQKYGAKGIKVCEKWKNSFDAFVKDMGERPSKIHSIDRIDGTGNYTPENCRWATPKEQSSHLSNNIIVEWQGNKVHLAEACRRANIPYRSASRRVKQGKIFHEDYTKKQHNLGIVV